MLEIDETDGDDLPLGSILDVSVTDGDLPETNNFRYKVVENAFGADKFTMVTNPDGTGSLKITKVCSSYGWGPIGLIQSRSSSHMSALRSVIGVLILIKMYSRSWITKWHHNVMDLT